jgi:hypothetical protein
MFLLIICDSWADLVPFPVPKEGESNSLQARRYAEGLDLNRPFELASQAVLGRARHWAIPLLSLGICCATTLSDKKPNP